ncbi:MAG TPA: glycosyl hydrolase, partial [Gemmatimonadaceae bacterium]
PHAAGTAYVAANRFQLGDMRPYLWKTTDYGKTWTKITDGIADEEFTRVIREDPERAGLLYAGTERGVWVSFNDGASWQSLQRDLPPVPVHDLTIKEGDLIAATHGRSFYVMDDLSALRQLTPQVVAQRAHLFQPRDAYRVQWGRGFGGGDGGGTVGANPPGGPTVYYWLKQPGQKVALEFLDASGKVIHRYESAPERDTTRRARAGVSSASPDAPAAAPSEQAAQPTPRRGGGREASVPNKAGLNQFTWDMRYPDAVGFQGLIMWAGRLTGPIAPPGTYQVRLTVGDAAPQTQRFALLKDPRTEATQGDLVAQFNMLIAIRDRLSDANNAVRTIRNVKFQLDDREKTISGGDSTRYASLADSLATAISTVEEALYQVKNRSGQDPLNYPIRLNNEIAALAGHVGSGEMAPTAQAKEVFALLSQRLDAQLDTLKRTMDDMLPRVNAILRQAGKAPIVPSTEEVGRPPNNVAMDDDTELEADHVNW